MEDEFKVGQLTKELVAIKLKRMDDPCAAAAELVKQTLGVALRAVAPGAPEGAHAQVVTDACQGGMTGLLLAGHELGRGAALMLEAVSELANHFQLDPTMMMEAGLKGIADMRRFANPDQLEDIRREVGRHFLGVEALFEEMLRRPVSEAERAGRSAA